jgi:hypothetical protein
LNIVDGPRDSSRLFGYEVRRREGITFVAGKMVWLYSSNKEKKEKQ